MSYTASLWFGRGPQATLSPVECARWGWRCTAADTLSCALCEKEIHVGASVRDDEEKRMLDLVKEGHQESCAWAGNPSPLRFTTLPKATLAAWTEAVLVLLEIPESLALPTPRLTDALERASFRTALARLQTVGPIKNIVAERGLSEAAVQALALVALLGWRPIVGSSEPIPVLRCVACQRDLPLPTRSDKSVISAPQGTWDAAEAHRLWCGLRGTTGEVAERLCTQLL